MIYCLFHDKNKGTGAKTYYENNKKLFSNLNKQGYGVFYTVNDFEVTPEQMAADGLKTKRNTRYLKKLRFIFADLDIAKAGDGSDEFIRGLAKDKLVRDLSICPPTMIIETANGLQPLWKINEDKIDEATTKKYVSTINGIIEWSKKNGCMGDAVKDVCRVLRMPGYYHMKEEPYMVKVIQKNNVVYTIDEIIKAFDIKFDQPVAPIQKSFTDPISLAIDRLDFRDIIIKAFQYVGRNAEFDKSGRLLLDGRLTGTFQGKHDSKDYLASSSHEPFRGNRITAVADILQCTNKEARVFLIEAFNIDRTSEKAKIKAQEFINTTTGEIIDTTPPKPYEWGTKQLTITLAPIRRNSYVLVVGETWSGKTTFTFNMAMRNAHAGHKVLYISLEMDTADIFSEKARLKSGVTVSDELYGIPDLKLARYQQHLNDLYAVKNFIPLGIIRGTDITFDILREIILEKVKETPIDLIFIDNLDLIGGDENEDDIRRQRRISKQIMNFTSLHNIPIVLIHHFRKKSSQFKEDSRGLDAISGSGKITHDADRIIQISRNIDPEATEDEKRETHVWQQKARGGYSPIRTKIYFDRGEFSDKPQGVEVVDTLWEDIT